MTVRAAIYDLTTGRILRTIECPADFIARQAGPGESFLEVTTGVDDTSHYIADGALVPIPARPGNHHTFDYTAKQWIDPRTLSDLQVAKWEQIKRARANAEFGGFTWDGSPFDSDAISQSRIQGAVQLAAMAPGFTIDWTLANNSVRNLSAADLAAVGVALGLHVGTQHDKARVLRAQIEAATTADEVDAVTW